MQTWFFDSRDPEQTFDHAVELGRSIGAGGLALALVGPLGAGKTVFVKGLAEGLGIDPRLVSSPTFVNAQQYPIPDGAETLHHVDLYRLESALDLESIGFDDMLRDGQVIAVEWADRFPDLFGRAFLTVEFEGPSPEEEDALREGTAWRGRRARVAACGEDPERVLADWAERIDSEKIPADDVGVAGGTAGHSSREMRLLSMLTLAIGAFVLGRFDFDFDFSHPPCDSLLALDEDELGTLHARCSPGGRQTSRPLTGIARLLEGEAVLPRLIEFFCEAPSLLEVFGVVLDIACEIPHFLFRGRGELGAL